MKRAVEQLRARVVARLRVVLPDAEVEEHDDGVTVGARGLKRRWVEDPSLAWWRQ
ncbi:hypothetical protein J2Y58_002282 [Sphingomonas sp. BE138]|uniref:hypothetical protein n=1 Tax=Sphingomonas sp. BE138 TaxID=2817845 RepID=UPI002854E5EB|nr:hypothetical protein [Sphingomonas sp. BE138]MDR6788917.1 hypothetical protein [Sphingomonas sp. BE138]